MLRRGRHSVSRLYAHVVCVTKYRRKTITPEKLALIQKCFIRTCENLDVQLCNFNGEEDHIHILVEYPPKLSISKLVNALKGFSSKKVREEFGASGKAFWSPSYFSASCGGAPLKQVAQYISNQRPLTPP